MTASGDRSGPDHGPERPPPPRAGDGPNETPYGAPAASTSAARDSASRSRRARRASGVPVVKRLERPWLMPRSDHAFRNARRLGLRGTALGELRQGPRRRGRQRCRRRGSVGPESPARVVPTSSTSAWVRRIRVAESAANAASSSTRAVVIRSVYPGSRDSFPRTSAASMSWEPSTTMLTSVGTAAAMPCLSSCSRAKRSSVRRMRSLTRADGVKAGSSSAPDLFERESEGPQALHMEDHADILGGVLVLRLCDEAAVRLPGVFGHRLPLATRPPAGRGPRSGRRSVG